MKLLKSILLIAATALPLIHAHAQSPKTINPRSQILQILHDHQVPGAVVALIAKDSVIWMGALGKADVKNNIPVTENTLFGIGSVAKTFLSLAAMVAQEKGLIDIHDLIRQIVPSLVFTNQWQTTDPVRLIHLLEHTSGFDEAHFSLFSQADASTPFQEVVKHSQNALTTRWRPGSYDAYNNLGAIIAAHALEEAVGQPFEEFVEENILLPLGMQRATYQRTKTLKSYISKGYAGTDYTEEPWPNIPQWPAGSLLTSIQDMTNLVRLFLNHGQFKGQSILSSSSVKKMETPESSFKAEAGVAYGYGKGLRGKFEHGYLFYGHDGSYGGFLSEFGYSRTLEAGYVILINNRDGKKAMKAIKEELLRYVLPKKELKAPLTAHNAAPPNAIAGCYQPITTEMDIAQFAMRIVDLQFVTKKNGQWYQKGVLGGKQSLSPVSDTQFRRSGESTATSVFVKKPHGNWQWLDETAYQQIPVWWGYAQFYTAVLCLLTMLLTFVALLVWLPIKLIRRESPSPVQWIFMIAIGSFMAMLASLVVYDPMKMYSPGAVLFLAFGWSFLIFSLVGLVQTLHAIYRKSVKNRWVQYHALLTCISCCTVATYLLYWGIIGLTLWNY